MKTNHVFLALTIGLTLSACSANKSVEKTTDRFIQALDQQDWDEARSLTTPGSHSFLNFLEQAGLGGSGDVEMYQYEILTDQTTINGDTAMVTTKDEFNNETTYTLVKMEGKWLIDFTIPGMGDLEEDMQELDDLKETLDDMGESIEDLSEQIDELGNGAQ